MPETRTTALAIRTEPVRLWTVGIVQGTTNTITQTAAATLKWFADTAQRFALLLAAIMGPAVLISYVFASWSLAANLGWTDSFPFAAGALSNWLIWAGIAAAVHVAAFILRRHTRSLPALIKSN